MNHTDDNFKYNFYNNDNLFYYDNRYYNNYPLINK